MSYKFESMMMVLNLINAGDRVTRESLTKTLNVTIRTADRYIATLRSAGFPINYDDEQNSYIFEKGYTLSKAVLTAEETLALGLAKNLAAKFGPRTGKVLDSIERKMSVCSTTLPKHIVFSENSMLPATEEHFRNLNLAIVNCQQVELTYSSAHRGGELSQRTIDPHYLVFKQDVWYCRAYCRLKKEPRFFALDRIQSLNLLDNHFLLKPEITPEELKDAFGVIVDGEPVEVVLLFNKCCVPYLKRFKNPRHKEKELPDGRVEVRFKSNGLKGVKLWLYRFIPNVEVVAPRELKEEMKQELMEAAGRV